MKKVYLLEIKGPDGPVIYKFYSYDARESFIYTIQTQVPQLEYVISETKEDES